MPRVKVVKVFRYRSARVTEHLFSMPRNLMFELENHCVKELGIMKDNHTAYQLECGWDGTIYVMFSDARVTFGLGIKKEAW